MNSNELIDECARFLARVNWQLCGSLSFPRHSVSLGMAKRCFDAWILQIAPAKGKAKVQWVRIYQSGAFPNDPIFHVLVGDMQMRSKYIWVGVWQEIAGDADIEYALCQENVSRFITGIARHGSAFEIDYKVI
jgi:hypothetical protein